VSVRSVKQTADRERRAREALGLAILDARAHGASWRSIASAAGRSVEGVRKIARAANEGEKSA